MTAAARSPHTVLDLTEPGFVDDPYPALARLRESGPIVWHEPTEQWFPPKRALANVHIPL